MADTNTNLDEELDQTDELDDNGADNGSEGSNGEGSGTNGNNSNGASNNGQQSGANGKTFSQDEVTRMMAKEKKQGRDALARELGYKNYAAMKGQVGDLQAYIKSKKTPEQENAEAAAKIAEQETRVLSAEAKAEAMTLDAKVECVDDIVTMAMSKYEDGADFKTLIGEIKTKYPAMFKAKDDGGKETTGKRGTGGNVGANKGNGSGSNNNQSMGQRLAAQRRGNAGKKSSFFS